MGRWIDRLVIQMGWRFRFYWNDNCVTNLLETFDFLTNSLNEKKPAGVIYLDFAKAFDKVSHDSGHIYFRYVTQYYSTVHSGSKYKDVNARSCLLNNYVCHVYWRDANIKLDMKKFEIFFEQVQEVLWTIFRISNKFQFCNKFFPRISTKWEI